MRNQVMMLANVILFGLCLLASAENAHGQRSIVVPQKVEGWYWIVSPKPWFTRQLTVSVGNRSLPKNDHDESLPTRPGYYHRLNEFRPFVRYPFKSVVVRKGKASFRTVVVKGQQFIFDGRWGTENDVSNGIDDVPYFRGVLKTYRKGKLVKTERVEFSHAVNA